MFISTSSTSEGTAVFRILIGWAMRIYRASPLYPRAGKILAWLLARLTRPRGSTLGVIDGVKFELDLCEVIDASLYYSGSFEPQAEKLMAAVVRPGMTVLDIGANIGYHTFRLAKLVGPLGFVVAVEPTSYAFDKLQRNLSLNNFNNIHLAKVGLADRDLGEIDVTFRSSFRLAGKDEVRTERIRILTLDAVVGNQLLTQVDFVKIDVDGYEGKVFAGATETLTRFRPTVFFEFWPDSVRANGDDPSALIRLLFALGYQLSTEDGVRTPDETSVMKAIPKGRWINLLAAPASENIPVLLP